MGPMSDDRRSEKDEGREFLSFLTACLDAMENK